MDFVLDAEGLLRFVVFPVLLRDDAVSLIEALRRERVRAKISLEDLKLAQTDSTPRNDNEGSDLAVEGDSRTSGSAHGVFA